MAHRLSDHAALLVFFPAAAGAEVVATGPGGWRAGGGVKSEIQSSIPIRRLGTTEGTEFRRVSTNTPNGVGRKSSVNPVVLSSISGSLACPADATSESGLNRFPVPRPRCPADRGHFPRVGSYGIGRSSKAVSKRGRGGAFGPETGVETTKRAKCPERRGGQGLANPSRRIRADSVSNTFPFRHYRYPEYGNSGSSQTAEVFACRIHSAYFDSGDPLRRMRILEPS